MTLLTLDPATSRARAHRRATGPAALAVLAAWIHRWRSRRALASLDDRMLTDIGMDPVDHRREIDKPFWRP